MVMASGRIAVSIVLLPSGLPARGRGHEAANTAAALANITVPWTTHREMMKTHPGVRRGGESRRS
jgi:hypothetical protein